MSKLTDSIYTEKISALQNELDRMKEEYEEKIMRYQHTLDKRNDTIKEKTDIIVDLKLQIKSLERSAINKSELDMLRIENDKLRIRCKESEEAEKHLKLLKQIHLATSKLYGEEHVEKEKKKYNRKVKKVD